MTDTIRTPAEALQAAAKLQRANAGRDPRTVEAMILGLSARIAAPDDETLMEMLLTALSQSVGWEEGDGEGAVRDVIVALREAGVLR